MWWAELNLESISVMLDEYSKRVLELVGTPEMRTRLFQGTHVDKRIKTLSC